MNRTGVNSLILQVILTINGDIHNIGTRSGRSDHACSGYTSGVMGVNVDRNIWVSLPNSADETVKLSKTS
jgi:hypothetical protein